MTFLFSDVKKKLISPDPPVSKRVRKITAASKQANTIGKTGPDTLMVQKTGKKTRSGSVKKRL